MSLLGLLAASGSDEKLYVDDVFSVSTSDNNLYRLSMDIAAPNPDITMTGFEIYSTSNRLDTSHIAVDLSGNKYILSYIAPEGKTQLSKYDSSNNLLWVRSIGEGGGVQPRGISINSSGDAIYVVCYNHRSTFDYYVLWCKYDSSGTLQAHKQIENGDEYNSASSFVLDSSENTYIIGDSSGTLSFIFLYKISSSGALTYQKRYYHGTNQYTMVTSAPIIDGSSIWIGITPKTTASVYESKIVKLSQSTGAIEAQYALSGGNNNTKLSLFVDASYLYVGISENNVTHCSIAKVSKTDPNTVYYSKTLYSRWGAGITPINVVDGNIYATVMGGGLLKFDSSLNLVGHLQHTSREGDATFNPRTLTYCFTGGNIIISSAYPYYDQATGYNKNFVLTVPNTFTGYAAFKMDDRNEFVKLNIKETSPVSVSFVTGAALTVDNDNNSIGNSTATFSSTDYITKGNSVTYSSEMNMLSEDFLMWIKRRDTTTDHLLVSNLSGVETVVNSNNTDAKEVQDPTNYVTCQAISAIGRNFIVSNGNYPGTAGSSIGWTFRKAPKFFDIVTYTGDGTSNRQIAHNLGIAPGMVIVKRTDSTGEWAVWHRKNGATDLAVTGLSLNLTAAATITNAAQQTASTINLDTIFPNSGYMNTNGATYVAYLFAHDTSTDGIIQCGSFTTDASGNATVNLGWEPQYLMTKRSDAGGQWLMYDTMRGFTTESGSYLLADSSAAEGSTTGFRITSTGFRGVGLAASSTYIYLAIRRPNKPPTTGTQVYNAIARTGTGVATNTLVSSGNTTDMVLTVERNGTYGYKNILYDRLRGRNEFLLTHGTGVFTAPQWYFDVMNGLVLASADESTNASGFNYIDYFFKRAVGVFDEVCYTGTGSATTVAHGLGVVPELMIVKCRSIANQWEVYCSQLVNTEKLVLNSTAAKATDTTAWNSTTPSVTTFTVGTGANINTNAATYVAYLFATKSGISKVGSYTGNGTNQIIDCGFTTGARFFMCKATSTTGSWWVFDTTRGIIAAADYGLQLNSTAAEITADAVDVDGTGSGIIVNSEATCNINTNGVSYIYLAFA